MISIRGLTAGYGEKHILGGINADINAGELVFLMGANGSGKTTLLNIMSGVIPHLGPGKADGEILFAGMNLLKQKVNSLNKIIGYCMQEPETQFFTSTVEEELLLNGVDPQDALAKTGLCERHLPQDPWSLSEGEKKSLAIATNLAPGKKILLFDEPSGGLDPENTRRIYLEIRDLAKDGRTVIAIEHDILLALEHADRIILLGGGEIIYDGPPKTLSKKPGLLTNAGVAPPWWMQEEKKAPLHDSKTIVEAKKIAHRYDGREIFSGINVQAGPDRTILVKGPNGSGKTTLLKILDNLLKPSEGLVTVDGKEAGKIPRKQLARRVGLVFQNPSHQIFNTTCRAEIEYGMKALGVKPSKKNVEDVCEKFGIRHLLERSPHTLSHGEKHKVAIASAMAVKPAIIMLDEPEQGLDYPGVKALIQMMWMMKEQGHGIILVTHGESFENLADEILEMEKCSS